ncbi:G protein-activated inward rectifier potassium channel 4, partial [Fragariocoptes setiger]
MANHRPPFHSELSTNTTASLLSSPAASQFSSSSSPDPDPSPDEHNDKPAFSIVECGKFCKSTTVSSTTAPTDSGSTNQLGNGKHPVGNSNSNSSTGMGAASGTVTTVTKHTTKTAHLSRLVAKNGTVNLFIDNIDRRQYFRDLFTTMIDIKWRYNLMAAAFGFVISWIFFACIWYMVLYIHGDLEHENDPKWSPCIVNVHSFSAAILFSIETQSTLGFGSRIISVECPAAIGIFCLQLIFGVVVECLIVGMVFAKLSRPAKRSQTIMYSKYATVCLRDDQLCLMFRVGDVRSKSHIIGATIRSSLVSQKITSEGEVIPFYHHQLDVRIDDGRNNLLLIWPVTILHVINRSSPFYNMNREQLENFKFEIITVIEGTVESTGQSVQVRTSYLPGEVKWGYRFEPIVSKHGTGRYAQTIIDYNKFNKIVPIDTPTCSAKDYLLYKSVTSSSRSAICLP